MIETENPEIDGIDRLIELEEDDLLLSDDEAAELAGEKVGDDHYHTVIDASMGNVEIRKPSGDKLAVFLANEIDEQDAKAAYTALRKSAVSAGNAKGNRFVAAGTRKKDVLEDGSISDTQSVPKEVNPNSGIAGYFDRYPRIPYCRQTAYTINNRERWENAIPFFQRCDELFEQYVPERYANQKAKAQETVDDWLIPETAFTTVTVNVNWQTAVHQDAGDLPEGFGVMPVIDIGDYDGAYFIQPKFGIAYDCRLGDMLLNDVHEWHGNGPFHGSDGYYERLSCVLYYRRDMDECGTQEEETQRAKEVGDERAMADMDPEELDKDAMDQVSTTDPDETEDA